MKYLHITIAIVLFNSVMVIAQPTLPPEPDIVPITGIEYLLLGGGAYGIYRFKKRNKSKENA